MLFGHLVYKNATLFQDGVWGYIATNCLILKPFYFLFIGSAGCAPFIGGGGIIFIISAGSM
jgi:hypothetical protein